VKGGHLLAIGTDHDAQTPALDAFLHELQQQTGAPLLPVYCGALDDARSPGVIQRVRVVFGERITQPQAPPATAVQAGAPLASAIQASAQPQPVVITLDDCKKAIHDLGEWIRENDDIAGTEHH
jgi:hypothetical protein